MSQQDLLDMLRERPFRAFRIHVSDGITYVIRHPEMMVVGRSKALVFFPPEGMTLPAIDRYEAVALLHIARMEHVEAAPSTNEGS
jgi:hypothetical protein